MRMDDLAPIAPNNEAPVKAAPGAGSRWKPGQSGNPKGTKRGSRHKASLLAESLIDGETDRLTRRCIYSALLGDMQAMKLGLERLLPPVKSRPISFKLPELRTISDAQDALVKIIAGTTSGALLADEAATLASIVSSFVKTIEVAELESRLAVLEKASADEQPGVHYNA
jgi:hypothetical protein